MRGRRQQQEQQQQQPTGRRGRATGASPTPLPLPSPRRPPPCKSERLEDFRVKRRSAAYALGKEQAPSAWTAFLQRFAHMTGGADDPTLWLSAALVAVLVAIGVFLALGGEIGGPTLSPCSAIHPALETRFIQAVNSLRQSQPVAYKQLSTTTKASITEHLIHGGVDRALTLHFAGGGSPQIKRETALRIGSAIFQAPPPVLEISCSKDTGLVDLQQLILQQLVKCPHSLILLHRIDELELTTLFGIEIFFEDPSFDQDTSISLKDAVFVLTSSLGREELKNAALSAGATSPTSADASAVMRQVLKVAWRGRPAFGGRLSSSVVPFLDS
uniref:Uncharacterized protein n=2 Tax=Rhizochromulina marina TaxID=1034831 RepID=A0A7S2R446_9STRA|mmetsp:Transcript_10499/g.30053  ORF Transcript_10499/g.30053 Transcript_10499/m.30053 type:complete len:329 (+) Transcript_10499:222-1208(+)